MEEFDPDKLAQLTGGVWRTKPNAALTGFAFDARTLKVGECFLALSGGARDGHDFIGQAANAGASAAIVERLVDVDIAQLVVEDTLGAMAKIARDRRDHFSHPVVGVTGSSGKTSTKEMLRHLLGGSSVHATPGNWNNLIGVPMTLYGLDTTEHSCAVVEAGINQPDEMACLGQMIHADLTVLTNIGTAHLELLKSQDGIAVEKSQLARYANPESPVVLPADALRYSAFSSIAHRCIVLAEESEAVAASVCKVFRCAFDSTADVGVTRITIWQEGSEETRHTLSVSTSSRGMAANAALAFVVALQLGFDSEVLAPRLAQWTPGERRGRVEMIDGRFIYADCYNANPHSMIDALKAFARVAPAVLPRTYVIGAMNELGRASEELHAQATRALSLRAQDRAIFIGPGDLVSAYRVGAISAGARVEQLAEVESVDSIKSEVAQLGGALFLKGSRSLRLEALIPETTA